MVRHRQYLRKPRPISMSELITITANEPKVLAQFKVLKHHTIPGMFGRFIINHLTDALELHSCTMPELFSPDATSLNFRMDYGQDKQIMSAIKDYELVGVEVTESKS